MTSQLRHLTRHRFGKTLLGWDPAEVTAVLEDLAASLDTARAQNEELRRSVVVLETRVRDAATMEDLLKQTAAAAEEANVRTAEAARKEAQLVIQDAGRSAAQLLEDARADLARLKEEITILSTKKSTIVRRLTLLLNSELEMVKALESHDDDGGAPASTGEGHANTSPEIEEILRGLERT